MKKTALLLIGLMFFYSCLNTDNDTSYTYEYQPIKEAITPANFTYGKIDSIKIKYAFPNGCYSFDRIYYEYQDTTRIVAVTALVELNNPCTLAIVEGDYTFAVKATQRENYIFKFYKGKDKNEESIFEEVVIPVN